MALVPEDGNALLNAIFLRLLPDNMLAALNDKGHLRPWEMAAAAALLHHPGAGAAAIATVDHNISAAHHSGHRPPSRYPSRGARA